MKRRVQPGHIGLFIALLSIMVLTRACIEGENDLARWIIDETGVKGGLVVHVGCGDGNLTAALRAGNSYLVHGLDSDPGNIDRAREHIRKLGLSGKVSVELWTGKHLPYIDNLVNLLVLEDSGHIPMDEVMRVLCPDGVACIKRDGEWDIVVKPRPKEIDEWTHFLHDATGNAVARDTVVGPPRRMQWVAAPAWARNHHKLASISAVVSAQGRIFYIVDEGPAASMLVPGKWFLAARDAFSGVLLWKRPISSWAWHGHRFRSGPVQLPRTLVASGDRVYAPLGIDQPLMALDAATGEVIRTYQGTEGTEEVILQQGILFVVVGSPAAEQASIDPERKEQAPFPNRKFITAIQAETGEQFWKWWETETERLMPLTLAADNERVLFQAGTGVVCLNIDTGQELWIASADKAKSGKAGNPRKIGNSVATLVVHDGVVLWADGKDLLAFSAEDGKDLWQSECKPGFRSPVDVLVTQELVWVSPDYNVGRDLRTGEIKKKVMDIAELRTAGHHHRCYREKATDRYIIGGYRGMEFFDLVSEDHSRNNWVRGVCQYGIMPCNGLVYAPSHACGCFMEAKLNGFWALAPASEGKRPEFEKQSRLEKGTAYGDVAIPGSSQSQDWPTYRHDPMRSGSTKNTVTVELGEEWKVDIEGRLSSIVVAEDKLLVASIDTHTVYALNANSGKKLWSYSAGGRVDSPPTIYKGMALFGSADGWVYCLRLSDGELVWRFLAAPDDLKTVAFDQVESVWPVHGNILIQDDVAYLAAGRQSYLDGGIVLYGLSPATGEVMHQTHVRSTHPVPDDGENEPQIEVQELTQNATDYKTFNAPDMSDAFSMAGTTTDILVSDGRSIFMRHLRFDNYCVEQEQKSRHLFSTSQLLDDAENHRSHLVLGTGDFSRTPVAYSWTANSMKGSHKTRLVVPYGLLLSFDDETVWGVRRTKDYKYLIFADGNKPFSADEPFLQDFRKATEDNLPSFRWIADLPIRPRTLIRTGETVFVGGMTSEIDRQAPFAAYEGRKGGLLWAISSADGSKLAEYQLNAPPVWDGMAVAKHRIYIATQNGQVLCMGKKRR